MAVVSDEFDILQQALNKLKKCEHRIEFYLNDMEQTIRAVEDEQLAWKYQRKEFERANDSSSDEEMEKDELEKIIASLKSKKDKCARLKDLIIRKIEARDAEVARELASQFEALNNEGTSKPALPRKEEMARELKNENMECVICEEKILKSESIWSCANCYNILHLNCVESWATNASTPDGAHGVSCPYCRQEIDLTDLSYKCFCGRMSKPRKMTNVTPHACGQSCRRECGSLCHPGPCEEANDFREWAII